jgi:hypothetical protein
MTPKVVLCGLLACLAACSAGQDYGAQFASTCRAQGLVQGSAEYDKCIHDLIAQQRARDELERAQFETLQSIETSRPLMPH